MCSANCNLEVRCGARGQKAIVEINLYRLLAENVTTLFSSSFSVITQLHSLDDFMQLLLSSLFYTCKIHVHKIDESES